MLVPFFTSYAFARSWDVTVDEKEEREEDLELVRAKFLQYSRAVLFALIILNVIVYTLPPEARMIGYEYGRLQDGHMYNPNNAMP